MNDGNHESIEAKLSMLKEQARERLATTEQQAPLNNGSFFDDIERGKQEANDNIARARREFEDEFRAFRESGFFQDLLGGSVVGALFKTGKSWLDKENARIDSLLQGQDTRDKSDRDDLANEDMTPYQRAEMEQRRIRNSLSDREQWTFDSFSRESMIDVIAKIQQGRSLEEPVSDWDMYLGYNRKIAMSDVEPEDVEKAKIAQFLLKVDKKDRKQSQFIVQ